MKKFTLIIILLILFAYCSQDNVANDSERNWCIGKQKRVDYLLLIMKSDDNRALRTEFLDIIQSLGTAEKIFRNDYDSDPPDILNIEKYLLSKDEDALRLCKIWTDIAEYKE